MKTLIALAFALVSSSALAYPVLSCDGVSDTNTTLHLDIDLTTTLHYVVTLSSTAPEKNVLYSYQTAEARYDRKGPRKYSTREFAIVRTDAPTSIQPIPNDDESYALISKWNMKFNDKSVLMTCTQVGWYLD